MIIFTVNNEIEINDISDKPKGSRLRFGQQVLDNTVENMPETFPDPLQYEGKTKESNLRFGQQGQNNTGENVQDPFPDPLEHEQIA